MGQRSVHLLVFSIICKVTVELTQVLQHLSRKVYWPLSGFLCTGVDSRGTQLWVGLSGYSGEALQKEYLEVFSRKSCRACVRTCTPKEFRYLAPVWSHVALGIYAGPFSFKIWLFCSSGSPPFSSIWSCSVPRVEVSGCSTVKQHNPHN